MSDEERDDFLPAPDAPAPWDKDDWDGTIVSALFAQTSYANWALQLKSLPDGEEELYEHRNIGVGKNDKWTSYDGGEEIVGLQKENEAYNKNSGIQKLINRAIKAGAQEELLKRSAEMYGKQGRRFAGLWVPLRFHWDLVEVTEDMSDPDNPGGKWIPTKVNRVLPTKFLGVGEAPKDVFPQSGASTGTTNGELPEDILDRLRTLARQCEDKDQFTEAASNYNDADGNPLIGQKVYRSYIVKEANFKLLKGS